MGVFSSIFFPGDSTKKAEKSTNEKCFPLWIKIALVVATIVKLLLVSSQTLSVLLADDLRFVEHATHIVAGHWLGGYDVNTLAKGPFYPLYIAATFFAGIPLLISQQLLYIAACATFVAAIRGFVKKPLTLFIIYLVILFNPMSASTLYMTRVLREGIYQSLTIFTISCCIGLLLQHDRSFKRLALWSTGLGFSLSFFWLTREEGIWLLPSVIIIVGFAMIKIWRGRTEDRSKRIALCVLPFVLWFLLLGTVASINKAHYDVFRITDFKSRSFLSALHALMRVKPTEWKPMLPVPVETRKRVYKVSPEFAKLKPFLEGNLTKRIRVTSCQDIGVCDDIGGGWFMWAFRASVARAGFYKSAKDADNYYFKLANEINAACSDKKVDCNSEKTTISILPPLNAYYLHHFIKVFTQGFIFLSKFKGAYFSSIIRTNREVPELRMLFGDVTNEPILPPASERSLIVLRGWVFHPQDPIDLSMRTKDGDMAPARIKTQKSPEVYNFFKKKGTVTENSKKSRFEIRTSCENCYLYVRKIGTVIERIPLKEIIKKRKIVRRFPESAYYANLVLVLKKPHFENRLWLANLKGSVLKTIALFYQYTTPFLFIFAIIIQIFGTLQIFRKRITINYVVNAALLIAIFARLAILSIIDITLFPAIHRVGYLSPAHPLLLMVIIFSLLECKNVWPVNASCLKSRRKARSE